MQVFNLTYWTRVQRTKRHCLEAAGRETDRELGLIAARFFKSFLFLHDQADRRGHRHQIPDEEGDTGFIALTRCRDHRGRVGLEHQGCICVHPDIYTKPSRGLTGVALSINSWPPRAIARMGDVEIPCCFLLTLFRCHTTVKISTPPSP